MARHRFSQKNERTNEFVFFFLLFYSSRQKKQTNSFIRFLGESTARKSAYSFIWPLARSVVWYKFVWVTTSVKSLYCFVYWYVSKRKFQRFFCQSPLIIYVAQKLSSKERNKEIMQLAPGSSEPFFYLLTASANALFFTV